MSPLHWPDPASHPGSTAADRAFFALCRTACAVTLRALYAHRAQDTAALPDTGPVLIACNHQSFLDPPIVGCRVTRRQLDFVARRTLFRGVGAWLLPKIHAFPIDESGGDAAAIKQTLHRLALGRAVVIFPEGTRSPDGAMRPYKRGIALLIKRARCPVLPAAVEGAFDVWPRGAARPRLRGPRVASAFGTPIPHDELLKGGPDAALDRLARETDALRLALRGDIRRRTSGRWPAPGPGDERFGDEHPG
mgnify:CR=1 FL=1